MRIEEWGGVKNHRNLSQFFFHWHFLITSIFKSLYFLKWCPIFDTSNYTNSQNSIISFGYVYFNAKIFLIFYPWSWNSITGNAIVIIYISYTYLKYAFFFVNMNFRWKIQCMFKKRQFSEDPLSICTRFLQFYSLKNV